MTKIKFDSLGKLQLYVLADFERFVRYAYNHLGFELPPHVFKFIKYVTSGDERLVILMPRGAGKTLLGCLYLLFRAAQRPNIRIRIIGCNDDEARKTGKQLWELAYQLPVTKFLVEGQSRKRVAFSAYNWTGADHKRDRDKCVECVGAESSSTGTHCDLMWFDDLEIPGRKGSPELYDKLIAHLDQATAILNPTKHKYPKGKNGQQKLRLFLTGTPHYEMTIYRIPSDDKPHPLKLAVVCRVSAMENGKSYWESRVPTEVLLKEKEQMRPRQWAWQYDLDVSYVPTEDSLFRLEYLKDLSKKTYPWWPDRPPSFHHKEPIVHVVYGFIDPSYSGDEWALSLAGIAQGKIHFLHCTGWHLTADKAIVEALPLLHEHQVKTIYIEGNLPGVREEMGPIIRNMLNANQYYCEIIPKNVSGSKDNRISAFLVTALNSGQAIFHPRMFAEQKTIDQMIKYTDLGVASMEHDDRIDCMSLGVQILSEKLYTLQGNNNPVKLRMTS